MVKKKWGERRRKNKPTSVFFCGNMHRVLSRIIYFPSHFIAPRFHTYPLFSSLEHFICLCQRHLTHRRLMSVRVWGYDHFTLFFPRLFSSLIYVTKDFINHQFFHGRPVSWSMTRKYHFSEASDGEWLIAQRNCVPPMFEQMSSRFKSDATSLLTDNTFKYPGKQRWMNRIHIISNLAEMSCRDETNSWIHCDGCIEAWVL
jgi:hypothetical protein